MPIDLHKLHEKTYGYVLRTGKRGSYKYWYLDSTVGKLYSGKKPDPFLIEHFPQRIEHPKAEEIIDIPWENYNSTNPQMIYAKDSGIPLNKIGLTSRDELEQYESFLLSINYRRIFENLKTFPEYYLPVNSDRIKKLHKKIFNDLYDWAGEYRNINMTKEGFPFPPADLIQAEMHNIDKKYFNKINYEQKASLEDLAELLSILASELNMVHPFREGNGRVIRVVLDILCIAFNYHPPVWGILNRPDDKQEYIKCVFSGYTRDYKPLANFIYKLMLPVNNPDEAQK